jgi:hypothetical protein
MSTANGNHAGKKPWWRAILVIFCVLVQSVLAQGQTTSNPNILIVPFGIWQVCESAWGAQTPACSGFTPGSEQFLLLIKACQPETTEYLYTIVATMQDGSTRAVSGQLKRHDNNAGFTSTNVYFGGVAVSFNTTIEEATIADVQSGTGTFQP